MKNYNIQNYIRYKIDVDSSTSGLKSKPWNEYSRDELIVKFLPLVENLARKFSTAQQASGVMDITDIIQEGSKGLVQAVDKINWEVLMESNDIEKTIKSFLSKRIKGAIRRGIDINRGTMRIPEHKLNEIRQVDKLEKQTPNEYDTPNNKSVEIFFNSIFLSLDSLVDDESTPYDVPEPIDGYNKDLLNSYLIGILKTHLNKREFEVVRLSYGLDCKKHSAVEIAKELNIQGDSAFVRVSQLKRQAINKLITNVDHSQVIDLL
jgi:RNA polymerase sigma factor (sigma-70 family)